VDQLRSAWATQFGGEPPIDVWAMHAYAIDWYNTPMTNATDIATDEQEIASFSTYLAGIPAHAAKPIWITEMGILWAYPGWTPVSSGCAAPPNCIAPTGTYDTAGVVNFLNQFIPWLKSNSSTYRLGKWFVYVSYGMPDPYQTQYGGISLLADTSPSPALTQPGEAYQDLAGP